MNAFAVRPKAANFRNNIVGDFVSFFQKLLCQNAVIIRAKDLCNGEGDFFGFKRNRARRLRAQMNATFSKRDYAPRSVPVMVALASMVLVVRSW